MSICTNCNWKWYNTVYKWEWWYTDFWPIKYIETTPMWIHKVPCSKCQAKEKTVELKKETTWQTVYEQLQEIADAFAEYKWYAWINIEEDRVELKPTWWYEMVTMSYHDLFSVESGIMEFVEWRIWDVLDNYLEMADKTAEHKVYYFVKNAIIPTNQVRPLIL